MDDDNLEHLISNLHVLLEGHRGDLIVETAKKILALNPRNLDGYIGLLMGYNSMQKYDLFLEACLQAIAYWPDLAWLHYMHHIYYYSTGEDWLKAKEAIEEAIKLDPTNAEYYRHLGEVYLVNREAEKAAKHLAKAVSLKPDNAEYRSRLALALLRTYKRDKSLKIAKQALKDDPGDSSVLDNVGFIWALAGELDDAENLFRDALRDRPTYIYFQKHLDLVMREKADREGRQQKGLKYTPLYLRHKGTKLHFDEDKLRNN